MVAMFSSSSSSRDIEGELTVISRRKSIRLRDDFQQAENSSEIGEVKLKQLRDTS